MAKFYGVEVKSTKANYWTSTGSSILETSRITDIERIFMTFGKLGGEPIEFISRPYEECLSGIAVTHMPRYLIDMRLKQGETIFDKMGVPYDELRLMDNPIAPVSSFYRSQLKPGERLWWVGDPASETVSATIRLWCSVPVEEKRRYTVYGCVNFPEIFRGDYGRYALWLTTQGVVDPHIRDQFSSGGTEPMGLKNGDSLNFPAVFRRVKINKSIFIAILRQEDTQIFNGRPILDTPALETRFKEWAKTVSYEISRSPTAKIDVETSRDALETMFSMWKSEMN